MVEAVRTTASPAAIWTIVVVAVSCLLFWLGAIALADKYPFWRQWQAPDMPGPALGGTEPLQAVPVTAQRSRGPTGAHRHRQRRRRRQRRLAPG